MAVFVTIQHSFVKKLVNNYKLDVVIVDESSQVLVTDFV